MNNVSKWVQNANSTLKKTISSATQNNLGFSSNNQQHFGFNKNWIHPPEVLTNGRVDYTVKFMGDVGVDQPKGTEVIKDAIKRLRFHLELKRSQGFKLPKVELQINLDGVSIVDPKSQRILYKYPLHRISFCADDKNDKRLFAFIAKQSGSTSLNNNNDGLTLCGVGSSRKGSTSSSNNNGPSKGGNPESLCDHRCFVFLSDKLAEQITLTIGEAFDLAYRRFLDNNGRDLETKRTNVILRKRIQELERENAELKDQLAMQQRMVSQNMPPENFGQNVHSGHAHSPKLATTGNGSTANKPGPGPNWERFDSNYALSSTAPKLPTSPIPPPPPACSALPLKPVDSQKSVNSTVSTVTDKNPVPDPLKSNADLMRDLSVNGPEVGPRLENLHLGFFDDVSDQDFDPRATENGLNPVPVLNPDPENPTNQNPHPSENNLMCDAHYKSLGSRPGGLGTLPKSDKTFTLEDFDMQIRRYDSKLAEMREGYKSGLSFGTDDFHMSDFECSTLNPKEFQQFKQQMQQNKQ